MATTPGLETHVYIGGTRKVLTEPAFWGQQVLGEISVGGLEKDSHVMFVPKIGWRLTDVRTFGYLAFDAGKDIDHIITYNGRSALAVYADNGDPIDDADKPRYNQRWLEELGVPQGDQPHQGDPYIKKFAKPLTGNEDDVSTYPSPSMDEPVPLDRCTVSVDKYEADDRFHFGFGVGPGGSGSRTLGPVFRCTFPGIPGTARGDGSTHGVGQYALTLQGDGIAILHELRSDATWAQRASFRWCESSRAMGPWHRLTIESDAVRDGGGYIYGNHIRFAFSSIGNFGAVSQAVDIAGFQKDTVTGVDSILDASYDYAVPNPSPVIPTDAGPDLAKAYVRIEARQDCAVSFQAARMVFSPSGTLYCKTFSLNQAPKDGLIHVQVFGHFPVGTTATLKLYGAKSGALCAVASVVADSPVCKFVDFSAIPGERAYVLNVEMAADTDGLKTPTVNRIRYIREANFGSIVELEQELTNVVTLSTTGCGADPSTETLGLVCYDTSGDENATLRVRAGQNIRVEVDLGPDTSEHAEEGARIRSVVFRGVVKEARRRKLAGKKNRGFNGLTGSGRSLTRITVRAVSEWDRLIKHLAPGRLDFAYAGSGFTSAGGSPFKITDAIRYLLLAVLPKERVDVPDFDIPLPLDTGAPTYIEKYQPTMQIAMTLIRDYLGGYLVLDPNASPPTGDPRGTTIEGMWRVRIAPKAPFSPSVEFCRQPTVEGVSPVSPQAYPDASAIEGSGDDTSTRPFPRTFLRYGSEDEWIEPPVANQIVVRGVGPTPGVLSVGETPAITVVLSNWVAANFTVEKLPDGTLPPQPGESGGPPAADPSSIDYTTGDVVTLYHSDPTLNTVDAVRWIANRLFDLRCHGKKWLAGEAPIVFLKKETTLDDLQVRPRPLRYADIAHVYDQEAGTTDQYVVSESPSLLSEGRLGGDRFLHGYYALYSVPHTGSYRAAYGDNGT